MQPQAWSRKGNALASFPTCPHDGHQESVTVLLATKQKHDLKMLSQLRPQLIEIRLGRLR